ncbi:MAG: DUF4296 domain-containing protein [Chitinophagales bacterium]|nr:DUF4296 domain-containing protein [Chitinophagales bacterium]
MIHSPALRLFCGCLLLLLAACQSNQHQSPVLADDKISRIMADLALADAATTGLAGYTKDSLMQVYFKQVFEIHGVTEEAYEKDLRILADDLNHMEVIVKKADELLTEKSSGPPLNSDKPLGR